MGHFAPARLGNRAYQKGTDRSVYLFHLFSNFTEISNIKKQILGFEEG